MSDPHERQPNDDDDDDDDGDNDEASGDAQATSGASGARKLAEWVTLAASALIVFGVAGFLAYEAAREDGPYVAARVRPLLNGVRQEEGTFILPVEVVNRGDRTLQDFRGEVVFSTVDGPAERREFRIDYLGERATQTVYVYVRRDPRQFVLVDAQPLDYRLE